MNLREDLWSQPAVYRLFKRIVLPAGVLERLVAEQYTVADGGRVLDLGCGFGDYAKLFAGRCDYLGIDHNALYIETAKEMNKGSSARFIVADVSDAVVADNGPFDLIMMSGVLHHLASDAVRDLARMIAPLLSPTGKFVALEPVFDPDQRLTARLAIAADRGRFARDEEGYRALLETSFKSVESSVVTGMLRIPYTHVVLTAAA
jgi:SAM-dependent methyltransferase